MLSFAYVVILAVSAVLWAPTITIAFGRGCNNDPSANDIARMESDFSAKVAAAGLTNQIVDNMKVTIPVYFHVLRAGRTLEEGDVPKRQVEKQIEVLNEGFKGTGVKFNLKEIEYTTNNLWFIWSSFHQTEMKNKLRKGGKGALNVYSVSFEGVGYTGYASWPIDYQSNPKDDGVLIRFSHMPGGTAERYNLGKTLTHEVGHWAGLYHTWTGGCFGQGANQGDMVADTPAEGAPALGCPTGRNTCEGGGVDPIHNFMDYTDDVCMNEFTKGQARRLKRHLRVYRGF